MHFTPSDIDTAEVPARWVTGDVRIEALAAPASTRTS